MRAIAAISLWQPLHCPRIARVHALDRRRAGPHLAAMLITPGLPGESGLQPPGTALLAVDGVGVDVADRPLLRGVQLRVAAGDAVALAGRSGLGKSTLLRALVGLHPIVAGTIALHRGADGNLETVVPARWPAIRREMQLVAQRPIVVAGSVRDNLALAFGLRADARAFDIAGARAMLDALGLDDVAMDTEARGLSEGQRQRLALAWALLVSPRLLLLDEPSSALDVVARDRVIAALGRFRADGGAVVVVSHDPSLLTALGAQTLALHVFATLNPFANNVGAR